DPALRPHVWLKATDASPLPLPTAWRAEGSSPLLSNFQAWHGHMPQSLVVQTGYGRMRSAEFMNGWACPEHGPRRPLVVHGRSSALVWVGSKLPASIGSDRESQACDTLPHSRQM